MTEQEWLACDSPQRMLEWLTTSVRGVTYDNPTIEAGTPLISVRKLRLFACACARQVWHLLTDSRSRQAVEVAERYADNDFPSTVDGRNAMIVASRDWNYGTVNSATPDLSKMCPCHPEANVAAYHAVHQQQTPNADNFLRDIVGNPFRPIELAPEEPGDPFKALDIIARERRRDPMPQYLLRSWLTPTVKDLALAAYTERVSRRCERCEGIGHYNPLNPIQVRGCPDCHGTGTVVTGELDQDRLGVLSDELELVGCDNEELLRHLRGEERCHACAAAMRRIEEHNAAPHRIPDLWPNLCLVCNGSGWRPKRGPCVRGCAVLDLLLGKE